MALGIRLRPGELARTRPRDWLIRFVFGAGVSAFAGMVTAIAGPRVGGVFLAFPAILLASLTLVAREEGLRQASDEARGATFGTIGLAGFAVTAAALAGPWPPSATLCAAAMAWAVLAFGSFLLGRRKRPDGADGHKTGVGTCER
jgi:hypothetical protein